MESWPLWRGGRCGELAVVESWPVWRGGRCREVAGVERWPLWRVGRCGELAVVERWPSLVYFFYYNVKLGVFTSYSCNDGKEMYKKA